MMFLLDGVSRSSGGLRDVRSMMFLLDGVLRSSGR